MIHDPAWYSPRAHVRKTVDTDAILYTDSSSVYRPLATEYKHETVDHRWDEYVRGRVHTNGIENFWALLNAVEPGEVGVLALVVGEHPFRDVPVQVFGGDFTYAELTG